MDSLFGTDRAGRQARANLFSEADLLTAYGARLGISENDYQTLLAGSSNDALLQTGVFRECRAFFPLF